MREILFRGKEINKGKWIEGFLFPQNIDSGYCPLCICSSPICANDYSEILGNWCIVSEDTIGQYTGLTDKNGKKIFEGDILRVKQCGETGVIICVVYFGEYIDADNVFDDYRCIGFYIKTVDGCCTIGTLLNSDFEFEVIGNIYDNPELLDNSELLEDKP